MADAIIHVDAPEKRMGNVLVYTGTITGATSHPSGGYPAGGIAPNIDFMVFNSDDPTIWDFDRETQIIQAYKITSSVRAVATGDDLDAVTARFVAFKFVG